LAIAFPRLDKQALWDSIGEALKGLEECDDGDVEKLGLVKFLLDEPNGFPMSPSTNILSPGSMIG